MQKLLLSFVTILALSGAGCASVETPSTTPPEKSANFGSSITLKVGQMANFDDGLSATLKEINDSRCPPDVACIWAGELSPVLEFSGGKLASNTEVRLGTTTTTQTAVGPYRVSLLGATEKTATISVSLGE